MQASRLKVGLLSTLALVGLASYSVYQGTPPRDQVVLGTMLQGLGVLHYQPEKLDDQFSQRVFDLYLKRVDVNKQLLLAPEVAQLRQYQTKIDDELKGGTHEFLDVTSKLLSKRTLEIQALYRQILAKPFDFTVQESLETSPEKAAFAPTAAVQREQWRKLLKYQTLAQLSELMDEEARKKDKPLAAATPGTSPAATSERPRTPAELEAAARKRVLKYYDEYFADQLQNDDNDHLAEFANVIANTYDPHTEYFAPIARDNFDIAMSGRLEGTGAQLQEDEGHLKVTDIVAGSASFRQGELKVGDIILRVAQGAAEPVSVEGMRFEKAVKLIRGPKGTEVRLTVRKPDGAVVVIPIIRDVVVIEETYAQSAIIKQGGKNYGYIHLPGFYADFGGKGGRSSAADVKTELAKLSKENVAGVILDLRYNGGGSLQDAVEMGGLFVPSGPMVQVKAGRGRPTALDDKDPQVQYAGPLVVMVNKYSASASEILAAAMQDYRRAIIVGSTTYGKGTVQQIIDLDNAVSPEAKALKPLGSLKLTIQKFYRVNGGSTQFKGVVPDITLPDALTSFAKGEQESEYPLLWDEISPAAFQPSNTVPAIDKLRAASAARVAASPGFRLITDATQRATVRRKQTNLSLNLAAYRAAQQQVRDANKQQTAAQNALPSLEVAQLTADASVAGSDSAATKRAARFLKPLRKDAALAEAVAVIGDELK
ncbi:carboxy terminal-processing peptidase [Hymenobacter sp. BT770]|uniref:carboxy terminal-processing peptidase n=1 Tax=Hymenobacter sp. BT770 TaxID=2886942 RepID=UPI001D11454E|nr:carboxy terminal-processing peptidase [Hymenobacter sp. BT770]MCC3153167.1 carboxy terminal-processing peptidase [Hymenobacter sp. BT770]MDO3415359.1 carboxy terminal-processing peptidase [Hymenobacter sp. BT770]